MRRRRPASRSRSEACAPVNRAPSRSGCDTLLAVDEYADVNRANWDERVPAHAASPEYSVDDFLSDPEFLSHVVRFDLPLLGDISGQRGVHLQCHIGTDTISLARLGASMTGVDFSEPAVRQARALAGQTGADATFVQADVYDAAEAVGRGGFDFVFTGVGALCWLPSVSRWARVVASVLRHGGRLFIREGHPVLWSIQDDKDDDLLVVKYPYFERAEPTTFDQPGTYVSTKVDFEHTVTHEWNHGLDKIVTSLLDADMTVTGLTEHDSAPWDGLPGHMEKIGGGKW